MGIKNFFLALSGIVIIYGLFIIVTKKESTKAEMTTPSKNSKTELAENGLPKTPDSLKIYLTPLLHENMGFKENLGLDPQASASLDLGDIATMSCGYRYQDSKGKLATNGKFQVSGSVNWHKDPSPYRKKVLTKTFEACLGSVLMQKTISENEFNAVVEVYTAEESVNKALTSGVLVGKKWIFNIIPTNVTESTVWILTER